MRIEARQLIPGLGRIIPHVAKAFGQLPMAGRAQNVAADRKLEVDLRQVMGFDNAGRDLLAAIQRAGACLIVEGVWMTALSPLTGPTRPTVNATIGATLVASNPFDVSRLGRLSGDDGYGVPFTTHEMLLTFPLESLPRFIVRV